MLNMAGFFMPMLYAKPPLTYDAQADLLITRGLVANRDTLIGYLKRVNYYRLSAYWHLFKLSDNTFKPNTTIETIWYRYRFDRQLRLLLLDGIERVEVYIRTQLTNIFSLKYGPFSYSQKDLFPGFDSARFTTFLGKVDAQVSNSKERFVTHYNHTYDNQSLPLWMLAEIMTYGMMFSFFRGTERAIQQAIAREFSISRQVLFSWLLSLNGVRNICAHHGRIWNRELGYKPQLPNKDSRWRAIQNHKVFYIITLLKHLLSTIAPESQWAHRVTSLITTYSDIPLAPMGFPENWGRLELWQL